MIILSHERPAAERVVLDAGDPARGIGPAWIELRPCTALEYNEARERGRPLVAGLVYGRRSEDELVRLLGSEFGEERGTDDLAFAAAVSERLMLIEIVTICASAWEGFGDAEGRPLDLNRINIALMLREPQWADRISAAVNRVTYERRAEGNASAASPDGAAAADGDGAAIALPPATVAPPAGADATASAAPSTNTNH